MIAEDGSLKNNAADRKFLRENQFLDKSINFLNIVLNLPNQFQNNGERNAERIALNIGFSLNALFEIILFGDQN